MCNCVRLRYCRITNRNGAPQGDSVPLDYSQETLSFFMKAARERDDGPKSHTCDFRAEISEVDLRWCHGLRLALRCDVRWPSLLRDESVNRLQESTRKCLKFLLRRSLGCVDLGLIKLVDVGLLESLKAYSSR